MEQLNMRIRSYQGGLLKRIRKNMITVLILMGILFSAIGCSKKDEETKGGEGEVTASAKEEEKETKKELHGKSVVLTVGNTYTTYEEIMLYMQSQKQEIESLYGNEIWSYALDDTGATYGDKLKEQVLKEIEYIKIVCAQAKELGIGLSEDEKMDVNEYTADFLSRFTEETMKYYGFTEESVRKIYEENVLANKIYERLTLNVDTDVSDEDARHIRLYYILMAKHTYDAQGNKVEYTEEELTALRKLVDTVYEKTKEGDFYILAREYSSDEDEIEIVVGKGELKPEFEETLFALKEGEVSQVLEDETGYFMFYCKSETDEEATAAAKEKIIIDRQNAAFNESYLIWEAKTKIAIDETLWSQISFARD